MPQCSLHSRKSKETSEVKCFPQKTRSDVGMVPCVSEEHVCLHGKSTGGKPPGTRRGTIPWSPTEVNILRHPGTIKEGYHSMLNHPGDHSAASYFKDTLDTSPSLHLAKFSCTYFLYHQVNSCNIGCFSSFGVLFIQVYYSSMSL